MTGASFTISGRVPNTTMMRGDKVSADKSHSFVRQREYSLLPRYLMAGPEAWGGTILIVLSLIAP